MGQNWPFGNFLNNANSNMTVATYLSDKNPNFYINNNNNVGEWKSAIVTGIVLETLQQTQYDYLTFLPSAQTIMLNLNSALTASFNRYRPLPITTKPLKEGESPDRAVMGSEKTFVTLQRYGFELTYSDLTSELSQNTLLQYATDILPKQAMASLDTIIRETIYLMGSHAFAGECSSIADVVNKGYISVDGKDPTNIKNYGAQISYLQIRDIITQMRNLQVMPWNNGKFMVALSYDGLNILKNDPYMIQMSKGVTDSYFINDSIMNFGDFYVYPLQSPKEILYTDPDNKEQTKVGVAFILGKDAYGLVQRGTGLFNMYTKTLGSSGTNDIINLYGGLGWKADGIAAYVQRSEALVVLHYAYKPNFTIIKSPTYVEENGKMVLKYEDYKITDLKDNGNINVDMTAINNGSAVYPQSLQERFNLTAGAQAQIHANDPTTSLGTPNTNNINALEDYTDPSDKKTGNLNDLTGKAAGAENIVEAIEDIESNNPLLSTIITVTDLGVAPQLLPTTGQIIKMIIDKNNGFKIGDGYIESQNITSTSAIVNGVKGKYTGTVVVKFTQPVAKSNLNTKITNLTSISTSIKATTTSPNSDLNSVILGATEITSLNPALNPAPTISYFKNVTGGSEISDTNQVAGDLYVVITSSIDDANYFGQTNRLKITLT